jgi:hypothetical protein
MKNAHSLYKLRRRNVVGMLTVDDSKHMIGDRDRFLTLRKERDGSVSFGNDDSAKIIGKGTIRIGNKNTKAENVLLVEDMKHNLLSVSQMCDQGHKVTFDSQKCEIRKEGSGKLIAIATRTSSNIYVLSEIGNEKCFLGKEDESWLCKVTYILITLSKSSKGKQLEKFPRSRNQPTHYGSIVNKKSKQRPYLNQNNIQ